MVTEPTELDDPIARCLARFPEIRVAYLFGSRAKGRARPDSDVDIALSLGDVSDARRGELILDVLSELSAELGALGERVDLLDFSTAGSTVAFKAIREGKAVFVREPKDRIRLEANIARRYDDERKYRELFRAAARRLAKAGEYVRG